MNTTIKPCIMRTCRFSSMSLMILSFKKSSVKVELEASTKELRVDIEADSTKITTMAMSRSGRPESMVGITESKPPAMLPSGLNCILSENSRPKPPRK